MKALLDNRLAPITFTWGFVESPFAQFSDAFIRWQDQLDAKFGTQTRRKNFRAPLPESLLALEPLTSPLDRYLLTETRSAWSAIFANGLRVNDVHSPVAYLPRILGCRGLEIACVPDRSDCADKDGLQIYGAIKFALYGPNKTDWLNRIRNISVTNDLTGWEFAAQGEVQPYEQTENYRKPKIVDRFTPEMLESYCAALGIELFDAGFYGDQSLLEHTMRGAASAQDPIMSIAEARSHVHIQGL
ncbi:MAG TPA: hypothetical protein VLX32_05010 [Candidatus Acidoferrum sp.]|nr:hypothetical protein [Candidatus Acidoferrum sp.]